MHASQLSGLQGSSTRETRKKTGGWTIFGAGEGAENPPLDVPHSLETNNPPPTSYAYNPNRSTRAFRSPSGVSAALPKSLASILRTNPPTSPDALLECLEDAAERGIPLRESSTPGYGVHEKGGGELQRGVAERRAPIGITHPPSRQVRAGAEEDGYEYECYGYGYTPFPQLKRRREVIDLGPLPP